MFFKVAFANGPAQQAAGIIIFLMECANQRNAPEIDIGKQRQGYKKTGYPRQN